MDIKDMKLRDRIIFAIKPILMYCIFVSDKQLISVLNTRISFLIPTIKEITDKIIILNLNFDDFELNITLNVENKEGRYIKVIGIE